MIIEILFASCYVVAVIISLWSMFRIKGFLAGTPAIADIPCLDRFKALVRQQMYLVLLFIPFIIVGIVTGIVMVNRYGMPGLGAVLLVNALIFGLGKCQKKFEKRARSIPTGSVIIAHEYQRVVVSWGKKPLPDF